MSLLRVENLHVHYGSIHAIKDISFEVNEGEIVTLIGANGAGKSTLLNILSGELQIHRAQYGSWADESYQRRNYFRRRRYYRHTGA